MENRKKNKLENGLNYILKKRSSIWVMKLLEGEEKTVGMKGACLSERMAKGNAFLFDIYIYLYKYKCAYIVFLSICPLQFLP